MYIYIYIYKYIYIYMYIYMRMLEQKVPKAPFWSKIAFWQIHIVQIIIFHLVQTRGS